MNSRLTRTCLAFLFLIVPMAAQPTTDWASLGKTPEVSVGSEIQVSTTDGKRHRGRFQSATDDGLILTTPKGEERLMRSEVARVAIKRPAHRGRNALIGLGIGAATGIVLGTGADSSCKSFCFLDGQAGKVILTPLVGLVGLAIGVAIPTGGWHDVYRAK